MRHLPAFSLLALAAASAMAQNAPDAAVRPYGTSRPIDSQYIVVFKNDVPQPAALAAQLARQHSAQVMHTYSHALKGFSVRLPDAAVNALRNNPNVQFVEQDATVSLSETQTTPPLQQANATWGLDRLDQRTLPLSSNYAYQYTGVGVTAFVIDTGILAAHADFGGRVADGFSAIADGRGSTDCNGHGTHVAGTVGGSQYGVAKGVSLVPVRVLDCAGSGAYSGVIAGVDWVAASTLRPAVANMSLGGSLSSALNAAVAGAVAQGVTMVVAAGNSNANACNSSPASEPSAITVGATASSDARASYSNYGTCVDIFAPGSSITSAWYTTATATNTISGTSMASPHVAGVAALALAANPGATPAQVAAMVITGSTPGVVGNAGTGSPNRMAYSLGNAAVVQTVAIPFITGKGVKAGANWRATATVTVKQFDGSNFTGAVSGATVSGVFSPGGAASCITGSTGTCTLSSTSINRSYTSSIFAVGGVLGSGVTYDASKNSVTSISVSRP